MALSARNYRRPTADGRVFGKELFLALTTGWTLSKSTCRQFIPSAAINASDEIIHGSHHIYFSTLRIRLSSCLVSNLICLTIIFRMRFLLSRMSEAGFTLSLLACIIHESIGFVNKHPQQLGNLCCGFRRGALHPLKASPERRPRKAAVEARRVDKS